jgi:putative ABC transport system permease protein
VIRNYFKTAWRNLARNKLHSAINIAGLSVGMAVAMLIGLWIWDEMSFNRNFENYDRIAQVKQNETNNGEIGTWENIPFPLGDELRKNYGSDFTYVALSSHISPHILAAGEKKLTKKGTYFEPQAPDMLTLKMISGSREGLQAAGSIMLSESVAKAFFGDADPINQPMKIDNDQQVKVTGVYKDLPYNSSFADLTFIAPWSLFAQSEGLSKRENPWRCNCYIAYIQLTEHADIQKVSAMISDIKIKNVRKEELIHKPQLFLHAMSKWHLFGEFKNGLNTGGRIEYVWLFGTIGFFVLLLACINFMNLSTARSEKRAKEVGIRKAVGSLRRQLIILFFGESLLISFLAFLLSLLLAQLLLPFFNEVADKKMNLLWNNPWFWLLGVAFSLATGLVAGSYPALYLSSFKPIKVLKGAFQAGRFAGIPRKILVVLQFTVSVVLIIGTVVVFLQIQFAKDRPIGYNRDGLVLIPMVTNNVHNHFEAVRTELLKSGSIVSMAESGSPLTGVWSTNSGFDWKGKDPGLAVDFPNTEVSTAYGKTVAWEFKNGRDFSSEFGTDSAAFVINESAAAYMGLKNPVGETVKWDGHPFVVIGVIKDMIMESPYEPVKPSIYHLSNDPGNFIILRINPTLSASSALGKISVIFKKFNPEQPFDYQFVDAEYAKKFGYEERIGKLATAFAGLAIFISCLGLFGLSSFVAEQRTKEISLRKVLGASVYNLWKLLSKEFVRLVIIALLIAIPVAYYFMQSWLQQYAYRTSISWWIFVTAGLGAVLITLITVSFQAIKAALANPIKSLRNE